MPRAGFYAIASTRITFGRDGRWYSDGEAIENPRIADLFSRHIRRHPDGGYQIQMGDERARIDVEDTPYVVVGCDGNERDGFAITLNDGTREPLDPVSLGVGDGEVLYCSVKGGTERARFLRPAYYQLAPSFIETDGGVVLRCRDQQYPIGRT